MANRQSAARSSAGTRKLEFASAARRELGLTYEAKMIRHWAYVSILTFYSESNLVALANSPMARLAEKVTSAVSGIWNQPIAFEARAISVSHDPLERKIV
jgi:hypothetical protein